MEFDRMSLFGDKISIRIPHDWEELDSEDDDHYTFHNPVNKLGWYRVSMFSKSSTNQFQESDLEKIVDESHGGDCGLFKVGDKFIAAWQEPANSDPNLTMYFWKIGSIVYSKLIRIVIFSLAVENNRLQENGFDDEIALVQDCIFATDFGKNN